jgi:Ser/Thr protein kinase RdoA (MazF antagonist)
MYRVTVAFIGGESSTYHVSAFEYMNGSLTLHDVQWRDELFAELGMIPSTSILAVWVDKVGDQV